MPRFFAIVAMLSFSVAAMGAIEFSEDQVAVDAAENVPAAHDAGGRSTNGQGIRLPAASAAQNSSSSAAALAAAQSTGAAGSAGTFNGATAGSANGGGGGNAQNSSNGTVAAADDGSAGGGGTAGPGSMALPEPSTALVWSVLAICGVSVVRLRRHK